jgi:hypothetical protein
VRSLPTRSLENFNRFPTLNPTTNPTPTPASSLAAGAGWSLWIHVLRQPQSSISLANLWDRRGSILVIIGIKVLRQHRSLLSSWVEVRILLVPLNGMLIVHVTSLNQIGQMIAHAAVLKRHSSVDFQFLRVGQCSTESHKLCRPGATPGPATLSLQASVQRSTGSTSPPREDSDSGLPSRIASTASKSLHKKS